MEESQPKLKFSGTAVLAGIVTFVLCTLVIHLVSNIAAGAWQRSPNESFIDLFAVRGLEFTAILLLAFPFGAICLTPVFFVTAALHWWRLPHAIYLGGCGGIILLIAALVASPEAAVQTLSPGSIVCFLKATAASLAFRHVSLKELNG
jgi:hypothetical protein